MTGTYKSKRLLNDLAPVYAHFFLHLRLLVFDSKTAKYIAGKFSLKGIHLVDIASIFTWETTLNTFCLVFRIPNHLYKGTDTARKDFLKNQSLVKGGKYNFDSCLP